MRRVAFADRSQTAGLWVPAVGEKHCILHDRHRPPHPAMRVAVASQYGFKILAGLALGLLNSRQAACVLAHAPHASLIGELGDWARYSAVFIKRRSRRLSERSAQASSCLAHATDPVPASIITCTSGSSQRLEFRTPPARGRRTPTPLRTIRACVQHFRWERQTVSENRQRCVQQKGARGPKPKTIPHSYGARYSYRKQRKAPA